MYQLYVGITRSVCVPAIDEYYILILIIAPIVGRLLNHSLGDYDTVKYYCC